MKKRFIKITFIALILIALLSAFVGCQKEEAVPETATEQTTQEVTAEPTEEPQAETVLDVLGNEIEIPAEIPAKIVSLTPSNTEMLFALGLGEYVVGVDEYSDYPEEALAIEKVGDYNGPNVEAIIALEPDIVLGGNALQEEAITQLTDVGIKIAAVEATTYEEIYSTLELVGKLTLTSGKAEEVITQMREKEAGIVADAKAYKGEPLTAYYAISAGESGNWTSGPGSLINDMFELLGIEAITDVEPSAPWMNFSLETLVAEDPDIILLSSMAFITVEDLCAMDGYKELTACKEGRVYMVDATITERPAVRIVDGMEEIYNAVYGS